jgi:hypothetical protein
MSTRTTEDIIIGAYHEIGEITPNEIPSQGQIAQGFDLLNDMIGAFSMSSLYIPFDQRISFVTVPGSGKYVFTRAPQPIGPPPLPGDPIIVASNLVVTLNFVNLAFTPDVPGTVIYPVRIISKAEFYGVIRINQLPGIPNYCFLDVESTESTIQFYPVPNLAYPVEIKAKVALDYVTRFTDITALPPFYFRFLRKALARELISYYPSANWPATAEAEYIKMEKLITAADEWNCAVKTDKTLNMGTQPYFFAANGILIV